MPNRLLSLGVGVIVYYLIVRPWRRERRLTLDGMLVIGFASIYWQDPLANYTQNWFTLTLYS